MSFSISIVVCTHNGANRISNCLSSLVSQENSPEYEILVVDNASTDGTGELVKTQLNSSFPLGGWSVIKEEKPGLLYARLAGLQAARYDWVLFCDDDNVLFSDFLFQCQQVLSRNSGIGVLGSLGIPEFLGTKPGWFERYSSSYAVGPQQVENSGGKRLVHVYGACSTYLRNPLLDLFQKGFNPVLSGRKGKQMSAGDDVEWCWLMQLMGHKVAFSEKLRFYHQIPASRLTWDYYLTLKRGISGSVGLLSAYTFYFSSSFRPLIGFIFKYFSSTSKSVLLYIKYSILWMGKPSIPENQLSFAILESQMRAFLSQGKVATTHFRQLKKHFGS
ncbi:glycosyltransferase family 2 protein [Algoriphagus lacus]|uniref:Glycosyltransferase family 2 protein n=1 Tax=Algoriphagus lacus TaxID=2056311 RepID=A0A418PN47_9BACT|nr:glycosyltransferase [Algoriphagus lacus]RIW13087.1 glycosyltransferase family 2 protein [Algoriphagus lacus]